MSQRVDYLRNMHHHGVMVKETRVIVVCDLPHLDGTDATLDAAPIRIETPRGTFALDVCEPHRREFVEPLTAAGARQTVRRGGSR
jgi:hypothetical protein